MNKAVLMSIKPECVEKILNGEKTIEVRKRFPKDFKGWVYIYCTKGQPFLEMVNRPCVCEPYYTKLKVHKPYANGKIVGRFYVDNVGEIKIHNAYSLCSMGYYTFVDRFYSDADLQVASCLNGNELMWYLKGDKDNEIVGYAIHISQLETFSKPKELSEFFTTCKSAKDCQSWKYDCYWVENGQIECKRRLTRPPQSWCYVEELEEER